MIFIQNIIFTFLLCSQSIPNRLNLIVVALITDPL